MNRVLLGRRFSIAEPATFNQQAKAALLLMARKPKLLIVSMSGISLQDRRGVPIEKIKATSNFCTYCGTYLQDWEKVIDHFTPWISGSFLRNSKSNLFVSCRECNAIKKDRCFFNLNEARAHILPIKEKRGRKIILRNEGPVEEHVDEEIFEFKPFLQKPCLFCGDNFPYRNDKQKFCSKICNSKDRMKRRGVPSICLHCNREFLFMPSGETKPKFCSHSCVIQSFLPTKRNV